MMKAEIRSFSSPNVDDSEHYTPPAQDNFGFVLQMIARHQGSLGEESFDMMVCTPQWLAAHHEPDAIVMARHYLIVFGYDWARLRAFIEKYVDGCCGETWTKSRIDWRASAIGSSRIASSMRAMTDYAGVASLADVCGSMVAKG
jgi:hypothetical protein